MRSHVDLFWFRWRPNFGDAVAPLLVERFAGLRSRWARPEHSEAVVIGSIAGRLPRRYRGVVLGIGAIGPDVSFDLSGAKVLGLRGELTRRMAAIAGELVLGDPGLLAADLLDERPAVSHGLGIVPHYKDEGLAARHPDAHHIDVGLDPLTVIREIATCERIISSSLHGLITADAFGIARRWEPLSSLTGGDFKFHDYASALGVQIEPEAWSTVPAASVAAVTAQLRDLFAALPAALPESSPRPAGLRRYLREATARVRALR